MHVHADVALVRHDWLAGVDPHAHPHVDLVERPLRGRGSRDCVGG
jgi:hypothetical protein